MTAEELKTRAVHLGFSSAGIASPSSPVHLDFYRLWLAKGYQGEMDYLAAHTAAKESVRSLLPGVQSVIVVSLDYNQPNPAISGKPKIARYALGRDYHKVLRKKLKALEAELRAEHPDASHRVCVDSAPVFEREFAHQAGLGWFGKNTCLIDSRRGSWFFIGVLLTSVEFRPDAPAVGGCGTCTRCIESCPTGAIVFEDERWQVDSRRCISYLSIEHQGDLPPGADLHGWTFGCDVCQEVCPFNTPRESQPDRAAFAREPDLTNLRTWPHLEQLAQLEYGDWDLLTRGSAVRRAGFEGLRRNARSNLETRESVAADQRNG
jgi:epoxyqueuosine reductase